MPADLANRARERQRNLRSPPPNKRAIALSPLDVDSNKKEANFARMYAESLAHAVGAGNDEEFVHDPRWKYLASEAANSALAGGGTKVWDSMVSACQPKYVTFL